MPPQGAGKPEPPSSETPRLCGDSCAQPAPGGVSFSGACSLDRLACSLETLRLAFEGAPWRVFLDKREGPAGNNGLLWLTDARRFLISPSWGSGCKGEQGKGIDTSANALHFSCSSALVAKVSGSGEANADLALLSGVTLEPFFSPLQLGLYPQGMGHG